MIPARIMLEDGINEFRNYIKVLREKPLAQRPNLNREPFSREFSKKFFIDETKTFDTKMELAEYLDRVLKENEIRREIVLGESGLWTWLAYIWFDQLAPFNIDRSRKIKEEVRYIYSSRYHKYYRHYIATPYSIYSLHGRENSRIFLYSPVHEHNDFIEQCASRQFIIAYKNIVEAITRLYLDADTKRPKRGAESRDRKGNIRRFCRVMEQFELTYDIYNMSPDQILDLLPDEFNEWK